MNRQFIQILLLSMSFALAAQSTFSASIKSASAKVSLPAEKTSLIEKALNQQKNGDKNLQSDNDLKVITAIKTAPTQSFFASQNQSFSRFLQSFFTQNNS